MMGNAERFLCRALLDLDRPEDALARCDEAARVHGVVVAAQQENLVVRGNLAYHHAFAARARVALAHGPPCSPV
jgi:hypothetical protein